MYPYDVCGDRERRAASTPSNDAVETAEIAPRNSVGEYRALTTASLVSSDQRDRLWYGLCASAVCPVSRASMAPEPRGNPPKKIGVENRANLNVVRQAAVARKSGSGDACFIALTCIANSPSSA